MCLSSMQVASRPIAGKHVVATAVEAAFNFGFKVLGLGFWVFGFRVFGCVCRLQVLAQGTRVGG